ncbi:MULTISPECIES: hypothetical protein [unclassified Actinoplanes]|uniref:hypothetical protein n=1 Tax=unclassified Actinoplanes TaxID=2626549 RepID=UPI001E5EE863|nr:MULTISPECIES: hypothetical protein [unclassified Actinoplanes]
MQHTGLMHSGDGVSELARDLDQAVHRQLDTGRGGNAVNLQHEDLSSLPGRQLRNPGNTVEVTQHAALVLDSPNRPRPRGALTDQRVGAIGRALEQDVRPVAAVQQLLCHNRMISPMG